MYSACNGVWIRDTIHSQYFAVIHNSDVIMCAMASQITSPTIVYSIVYSSVDQRKHQSSASLAFVRGIHRWPVNSPHKGPVTRKMFPFDDVIMISPRNTKAISQLAPAGEIWMSPVSLNYALLWFCVLFHSTATYRESIVIVHYEDTLAKLVSGFNLKSILICPSKEVWCTFQNVILFFTHGKWNQQQTRQTWRHVLTKESTSAGNYKIWTRRSLG